MNMKNVPLMFIPFYGMKFWERMVVAHEDGGFKEILPFVLIPFFVLYNFAIAIVVTAALLGL